ncbi:MAG: deoxyribodipyrimidine photo-lyase [Oscillatoriaceae bacterium SKW80]|nr:deoxyribodipyrimidine photo-lyase [Oscillatoriaceae bacterium SKYG93]MCX8121826.1 deoxyribodipyrimidine photo-lyase [Oscillatoriaceae bacterium SKW80]MDW8454587.1 FAD-binding domain-containing protein [Oscillatoriaceae cyanobacterium SKYGB_i_bin93]HIK27399.1 deoxyribodipyrimidine photo-lyase [Oscillatoriaceae cyanobacterium M7585_C2015_266]
MSELILFWHRRDLRIVDNVGLAEARRVSPKVVGVFCFDSNLLKQEDTAPARVTYMIGCLQELALRYAQAGTRLLILKDEPSRGIPALAAALNAKAVYWNLDVEPYSRKRDSLVSDALKQKGIAARQFWDQLLHSPEEIYAGSKQPYTVYTPFWKNWNSKPKPQPVEALQSVEGLTEKELEAALAAGAGDLPTAKDLGFAWDNPLVLQPGETAALKKLQEFCSSAIYEYKQERNLPAKDGTSGLSAALKFGAVGIRTVWAASVNALEKSGNEEARASVQTWQQELAWREFYQHAMYHFPELAAGAYRQPFKNFPWQNREDYFQAWCEGKTGYPIVDAAMRQMNQTGWMHNRCRMIVASFLTKDLIINWQWGEKYFMQKLIDGDLSANNGGWQWSASSGMDAKPLRIFNPATQAEKFDPKGEYIRRWLPELAGVETKALLSGKILPLERQRLGYPAPIVEHNQQQRYFKELYQQQKFFES